VKTVWFDGLPPVSRKKFHIPQRASQGRRSTEGDRVEQTTRGMNKCEIWSYHSRAGEVTDIVNLRSNKHAQVTHSSKVCSVRLLRHLVCKHPFTLPDFRNDWNLAGILIQKLTFGGCNAVSPGKWHPTFRKNPWRWRCSTPFAMVTATYPVTQNNVPVDSHLWLHSCENLISPIL
jgi:hypothetical protein